MLGKTWGLLILPVCISSTIGGVVGNEMLGVEYGFSLAFYYSLTLSLIIFCVITLVEFFTDRL